MTEENNMYKPNENPEDLSGWCYIEIFGHSTIAGRVSTKKLGVSVMFQIDVPDADTGFSHSELYSPSAIFSIKPTTEDWCRKYMKMKRNNYFTVLPYIPGEKQLKEYNEMPEDLESEEDD